MKKKILTAMAFILSAVLFFAGGYYFNIEARTNFDEDFMDSNLTKIKDYNGMSYQSLLDYYGIPDFTCSLEDSGDYNIYSAIYTYKHLRFTIAYKKVVAIEYYLPSYARYKEGDEDFQAQILNRIGVDRIVPDECNSAYTIWKNIDGINEIQVGNIDSTHPPFLCIYFTEDRFDY